MDKLVKTYLLKYSIDDYIKLKYNKQYEVENTSMNMILLSLYSNNVNIKIIETNNDLVLLCILLRKGKSVDDLVINNDLAKQIMKIHNDKNDYEDYEILFLYKILLNESNDMFDTVELNDYYNVIVSHSNTLNIKKMDFDLLKISYRSYNYNKFIEIVENFNILPDYIMINDIITRIKSSKGLCKIVLKNVLSYCITKGIKLDDEQCKLLLEKHIGKEDTTVINFSIVNNIRNFDTKTTYSLNETEIINIKGIDNLLKCMVKITIDNNINELTNYINNIIINNIDENISLNDINIPKFSSNGIILSKEHCLITFCKIIENMIVNFKYLNAIQYIKNYL